MTADEFIPMVSSQHLPMMSLVLQMKTVAELQTIRLLLCDVVAMQRQSAQMDQSYPGKFESQMDFSQERMNAAYNNIAVELYKMFGQ